ncbi:MAG: PEP-CTERM sorting domain-containing protein [Leptothrix sp. (in: b-proteobacteria)]
MNGTNLKLLVAAIFAVASMASHAQTSGNISLNGWYDSNISGGGNVSLTGGLLGGHEVHKTFTSYVDGMLWLNFNSSGSGLAAVFANNGNGGWSFGTNLLNGVATDTQFNAGAHSYSFAVTNNNSYAVYLTNSDHTPLTFSTMGVGSVAAVPEPETYAMLLAGLGVLGFTGRRRMKQG